MRNVHRLRPADRSFRSYLAAIVTMPGAGLRLLAVGALVTGLLIDDGIGWSDLLLVLGAAVVSAPIGYWSYRTGRMRRAGSAEVPDRARP